MVGAPLAKGNESKVTGRVDRNIKIKPTPTDRLVPSMQHVVRLHSSPPLPLHWCLHASEGKKEPRWISQEQEQTLVFVFYFGKVQLLRYKDAMVGRSWELDDVAKVGLKAELWVGGVLWDYILEGLTGRKL